MWKIIFQRSRLMLIVLFLSNSISCERSFGESVSTDEVEEDDSETIENEDLMRDVDLSVHNIEQDSEKINQDLENLRRRG